MSDHQRSLLGQKETQHQLTTALCPGKDKGRTKEGQRNDTKHGKLKGVVITLHHKLCLL